MLGLAPYVVEESFDIAGDLAVLRSTGGKELCAMTVSALCSSIRALRAIVAIPSNPPHFLRDCLRGDDRLLPLRQGTNAIPG